MAHSRGVFPQIPGRSASMSARPEILEGIPFFQTLDGDERAAVASLMKEARFTAGATVFREKEPGGVLYVIKGGKVELSVTGEDGAKVVVDVLEPGEFFGEMSLLDGGGRSTSATATEDVEAYSLSREEFLGLRRRRADVAVDVMAALARPHPQRAGLPGEPEGRAGDHAAPREVRPPARGAARARARPLRILSLAPWSRPPFPGSRSAASRA